MMTSHFLKHEERVALRDELHRVLQPGGWLFMKTFLKDADLHTIRLLKDFPAAEEGAYIHPVMGVAEYVYSEAELVEFLKEKFIIRKVYRSHRHRNKKGAGKRRTISIYAEKDYR
jgi:predicted SAM-dependent methyltransferase